MTLPTGSSRRAFLWATAAACCPAAVQAAEVVAEAVADPAEALARLEARIGGRLGVYALDTDSGCSLEHRADELFAMCSTFKWLLAAQLLSQADRGEARLNERMAFSGDDLLDHAPVTRAHLRQGSMALEALAAATVITSDNTAANLLLKRLGGPAALTAFARQLGDPVTRLDRTEPSLNENQRHDPRDTTSPRAMTQLLRAALLGDALKPRSRHLLLGWMRSCETGDSRLRAGFPKRWQVGDKTGTGPHQAVNDVAIARPPGRKDVLVSVYISEATAARAELERTHADVARLVSACVTKRFSRHAC